MPRDGFRIELKGFKEFSRALDDFARETERRFAEPIRLPVQFELDDDGYLDRACPAPECRNAFKVLWHDFEKIRYDQVAYCVVCRNADESQEFHTPSQQDYLRRVALNRVATELAEASRVARLNFRPNAPYVPLSAAGTEALTQRTTCTACGCRYATLGSSFFCHACGHHAAIDTFAATLKTVRGSLDLDLGVDRDAAADMRRFVLESGLGRVVNAFEAFAAQRYEQLAPSGPAAGKNAFQNLDWSNRLWRPVLGRDYTDMLAPAEYSDLRRLIQQRHLSHRGGMVDQEYIDKSGDMTYRVGQRLEVKPESVEGLIQLVEKLAVELR
jgi:hypothetical protein